MFRVNKGAKVRAISLQKGSLSPKSSFETVMKRVSCYDKHHVVVDPVGVLGRVNTKNHDQFGVLGQYVSMGYYGFALPEGSGYDMMLVKSSDVTFID